MEASSLGEVLGMFTEEQIAFVRERVEAAVGIHLPFETDVSAGGQGLSVRWSGRKAEIRAEGINALARGFFLLARAVRENLREGERHQVRHKAYPVPASRHSGKFFSSGDHLR